MNISRARAVRHVLWIVLMLNLAVTLVKFLAGMLSGSLSVIADAFQSLVDVSSNVVGLLGMWVSARPPDDNHPYGHQKYEAIAAMGIVVMSLIVAYEIGKSVIDRFMGHVVSLEASPLTMGLMIFTFFVNLAITFYETRAGKTLQSQIVLADAAQTRANLWITVSATGSLLGAQLGLTWLDSVVAVIVIILIVRSTFEMLQATSNVLTDVAIVNPSTVSHIAMNVPHVARVSRIRSRGHADAIYVDLQLQVHPHMETEQAHNIASEVERRIVERIPGVVEAFVHIEPADAKMFLSPWQSVQLTARRLADGLGIGVHDLHAHFEQDGGYSLEAHLEVESLLTLGKAHTLADLFERRLREALPGVSSITTHIEPLVPTLADERGLSNLEQAEEMRQRMAEVIIRFTGAHARHHIELHNVDNHLSATLHLTQPGEQPLVESHEMAEQIERVILMSEPRLHRVVIHIEPPE